MGMAYFLALVGLCDRLAYMRMYSGAIGAGVAQEIETALTAGKPVYEVVGEWHDVKLKRIRKMPAPVLSVAETRKEIEFLRWANPNCERPLFVPLRTQPFERFKRGMKSIEYRPAGGRFHERSCRVGRRVTLSHGGSGERISKMIAEFRVIDRMKAPKAVRKMYPRARKIAAIRLV
jgi:hypothetical protein